MGGRTLTLEIDITVPRDFVSNRICSMNLVVGFTDGWSMKKGRGGEMTSGFLVHVMQSPIRFFVVYSYTVPRPPAVLGE